MRWFQLVHRETIITFVFWLSVFPSDCRITRQCLQLSGCCVLQFDIVIWNHLGGGGRNLSRPQNYWTNYSFSGHSGCPHCQVFLSYLHIKRKTLPLLTIRYALCASCCPRYRVFQVVWFWLFVYLVKKDFCLVKLNH